MHCPACHSVNGDSARFCGDCGHALEAAGASQTPCVHCGHLFPSKQKFCGECGGKRSGARPKSASLSPGSAGVSSLSPEAALSELKIVTVLFSDMCGFTSLSERLGVEELRDLMNGWFDRLSSLIPTFGGTIDKFIGDAVMALFGAPVAHENDPKRAIDAALAMQTALDEYNAEVSERIGVPMQIRIGINTGRVYAGMLGGDNHKSYTVMGDAVNVASRLESACPIGSILVSESTLEHVRGVYEVRPQAPLTVKGKSEALTTYEVLGRRLPSERSEGNEDAIIALSRNEELSNVIELFNDVQATNTPQVVAVLAGAGMAKNQFSSCLAHRLRDRALGASLATYCDAGLGGAPFQVLADWLGHAIGDGSKLEDYLGQCGLPDEAIRILTHVMRVPEPMLGPPATLGDPSALRHATLESARLWLRSLAKRGPLLLRIHNLHNAPDTTRDLLSFLSDTADLPLLLVVTAAPHAGAPDSFWAPLISKAAQLTLEALDADASYEVASHMLSPMDPASAALTAQVAEASGGNPGFMEESVRALLAQGILIETDKWTLKDGVIPSPLPIPDTVGRMIQVRVDGLSPLSKLILQHATIIGARFDAEKLAAMQEGEDALRAAEIEDALREPLRAGLVSATRRAGQATEYRFRPALVRDEIYETVVGKQRREWHKRLADSLRHESPVLSSMQAATMEDLAAHVLRAGNHLEAAKLYRKAGDSAAAIYANSDARRQYEAADDALKAAKASAEVRAEVLQLLGRMRALGGEHSQAQEAFETALSLLGDSNLVHRAELEVERGRSFAASGERGLARESYERVISLLSGKSDDACILALADAQQNLGWLDFLESDHKSAELLFRAALDVTANMKAPRLRARCYDSLGFVARVRGETAKSIQHAQNALTLRLECGDTPTIATSLLNLGAVQAGSGDYESAAGNFQESSERHLQRGNTAGVAMALVNLGGAEIYLGRLDAAIEHLREATAIAVKLGAWYAPECYRYSAEAALLKGDGPGARALAMEGFARLGDDGPMELRGNLHGALGYIDLKEGALADAEAHLAKAASAHENAQNSFELAVTITRLSELASAQHNLALAKERLLRARSLFEEASNVTWVERCNAELARLDRDAIVAE